MISVCTTTYREITDMTQPPHILFEHLQSITNAYELPPFRLPRGRGAKDVAVSTACGMLNAIVVESTEDAQAVIEFIRRQARGRRWCQMFHG